MTTTITSSLPKMAHGQATTPVIGTSSWPRVNEEGVCHPNLGLHHAAATGNVDLVRFALQHGQPTTSVLNGILPLHAACSGGDPATVSLLLSFGADVNACRLRAAKGTAGASIGAEGSTALHFAAANGHSSIVRILLEHGARPAVQDRDGLTPEALAKANGHIATAAVLRTWIESHGANGMSTAATAAAQESHARTTLRNQNSLDHLSTAAAGVKASLRNTKKHALAKVSSHPNLKSGHFTYSADVPAVPAVPFAASSEARGSTASSVLNSPTLSTSSTLSNLPFGSRGTDGKRRPSLPMLFDRTPSFTSNARTKLASGESGGVGSASRRIKRSFTSIASKMTSSNDEHIAAMHHRKGPAQKELSKFDANRPAKPSNGPMQDYSLGSGDMFLFSDGVSSTGSGSNVAPRAEPFTVSKHRSSSDPLVPSSPDGKENFRPRKDSTLSSSFLSLDGDDVESEAGCETIDRGTMRPSSATARADDQITLRESTPQTRRRSKSVLASSPSNLIRRSESSDYGHLKERVFADDEQEFLCESKSIRFDQSRSTSMSNSSHDCSAGSNVPLPSSTYRQRHKLARKQSGSSLLSNSPTRRGSTRRNSHHETTSIASRSRQGSVGSSSALVPHADRPFPSDSTAISMASVPSTTSLSSSGGVSGQGSAGLSASEHAQAIIRSAEEGGEQLTEDGKPLTLTQMLAAYGEALAHERKLAKAESLSVRNSSSQSSLASLRQSRLPIVSEDGKATRDGLVNTGSIRILPIVSRQPISTSMNDAVHINSRTRSSSGTSTGPRTRKVLMQDLSRSSRQAPEISTASHDSSPYIGGGYSGTEESLSSGLFNVLRPGDWDGDIGQLPGNIKGYTLHQLPPHTRSTDVLYRKMSEPQPLSKGRSSTHQHAPSWPNRGKEVCQSSEGKPKKLDAPSDRALQRSSSSGSIRHTPTFAHGAATLSSPSMTVAPSPSFGHDSTSPWSTHSDVFTSPSTDGIHPEDHRRKAKKKGVVKALLSGLKSR